MNVFATVPYLEHCWFVARSLTLLANELNVRQKLHLHRDRAVALASLAAPSRDVERKMSRPEPALLRFRQGSEQVPHRIERLDIRDRIRPWRPPDRRLIYQHHFLDKLIALQALPARRRPRCSASGLLLRLRQSSIQHLVQQRRLAGSRNAGNRDDHAERNADIRALEVIGAHATNLDLLYSGLAP